MAVAYSKDLRDKIVSAYLNGCGTIAELAILFNVCTRTVKKYLKQMRETGDLTPGRAKGRPPIMNANALKVLKKIVEKNNDKTLKEYSELLKIETNISVCKSTIENSLKKLNYNRKKKRFFAQEQLRKDVKKKK